MKHIFKYNLLLLVLLLASSCNDWLTEVNPNKTTADSYWKDLDQTNSTLTATYSTLLSAAVLNTREEAWRSDLAVPGYGRPSYSGDGVVWYSQLYNSSNPYVLRKWEALYLGIFRANQTIFGLNKIEGEVDVERWTQQMAQARFFRGLFHFYAHSSFNKGDIIIKDEIPDDLDSYNTKLSKSEDVIKFFREDLQYAYDNLPVKYESSTASSRVTRGTAATILGTSYLYQATANGTSSIDMSELEKAIEMFEDVTNINNVDAEKTYSYSLERDTLKQFTFAGELNNESILEIEYSHGFKDDISVWADDRLTNRMAGYSSENSSNAFFPSMWITEAFLNEPLDSLAEENYRLIMDETDPNNLVPIDTVWRSVSLRASAMIALAKDEHRLYYGDKVWKTGSFNEWNGASRYRHYSNADRYENEDADSPGGKFGSDKNITINRLGDVYLMLAECYIYQGKTQAALSLINQIRGRWKLQLLGNGSGSNSSYDGVTYTAESLLTRLQNIEKPLETSVEGHCTRWFDLRRWGMLKSNFEHRAKEVFWAEHYLPLGETKTKWNCSVTKEDPNDPDRVVYTDYEQAALNFNYDNHAWFNISSAEIANNQGL